ncbi:MAG: type II secretion system protein GspJ [Candidatus Omnitrophica bacterium]|nr:type II secretion system protein GspJ [Candidatus Omnitrophota bacterium]MCM8806894.1 type II secretion system protein GspJ [Candidatus Omnitrophota bacterium]
MKVNILSQLSEEDKGITLLESIIAIFVFTFICLSVVFILRNSLLTSRKKSIEKDILRELIYITEFIETRISNSMINNFSGKYRMNFKGEKTNVKFICPFSEGEEGDIVKFGIYWKDGKIMAEMIRVNKENPDFTFFEGFPGAQILGNGVKFFSLRYYDGEKWHDRWDTEEMENPVLPKGIELKIVISKGKIEGREIEKGITKFIKIGWR